MKKLSRLLAVILAFLMLSTVFVGCHEKDEIAYTIGESKFTSAMYSCVLYVAATNARADIDTYIKDNNIKAEKVKYDTYKFDAEGKVSATGTVSYNTQVKNEAFKFLKQYAALDYKLKEANITVDSDVINSAKIQASYYWYYGCDYDTFSYYYSYGVDPSSYFTPYAITFEANGVGYSTYEKYMIYETTYNYFFEKLYGEGGSKEIPTADLEKFMKEHYVLGDIITFSKKDSKDKDLTDAKLKELKAIIDKYAERLNKGEDFKKIYDEENKRLEEEAKKEQAATSSGSSSTSSNASSSATSSTTSSVTSSTTSSTASSNTSSGNTSSGDNKYSPEAYKAIFGDEETSSPEAMFKEYAKQELGKAVVLEDKDNSRYVLFVRRDMFDKLYEDYFFDNLRINVCYSLKQDEYDESLDGLGNSFNVTEDTHATGPFDVEDITY